MTNDELLSAVQTLNPRTLDRARRLAVAVSLLRLGNPRRRVCALIRARFAVCQVEAWRIVDMASDMTGPPK